MTSPFLSFFPPTSNCTVPSLIPFAEPPAQDFGYADAATPSTFGGLHFSSSSASAPFVPQYNVAAWWRRPELEGGAESGTVSPLAPLLAPRLLPGCLSRPPGVFPLETSRRELNQRNLLSARLREDEKRLDLWTVSERSDRRSLERYGIRIGEEDKLKKAKIRGASRVQEPLLELRPAIFKPRAIWTRAQRMLQLWDPEGVMDEEEEGGCGESSFVFRGDNNEEVMDYDTGTILSWSESCDLPGELLLLEEGRLPKGRRVGPLEDRRCRMWHGSAERLIKTEPSVDRMELVCHSAHPRVPLIAYADGSARLVDLRCPQTEQPSPLLYKTRRFHGQLELGEEFKYIPVHANDHPARIRHMLKLQQSSFRFLFVSQYAACVVDQRMTSSSLPPLLTQKLALPEGSDVILEAPSVRLESGVGAGSLVHSLHFLSHAPACVHEWRLVEHPNGLLSTAAVPRKLEEPPSHHDAWPTATRALAMVPGLRAPSGAATFWRLRAMDSGALWSERVAAEKGEWSEEPCGKDGWWNQPEPWEEEIGEDLSKERELHPTVIKQLKRSEKDDMEEARRRAEDIWEKVDGEEDDDMEKEMPEAARDAVKEAEEARRNIPEKAVLSRVLTQVFDKYAERQ